MRAFVYLRQSLDKTGEGAAVERQRSACLELCDRRGYTVEQTFRDNSVSASSGKRRPQYEAMLEGVRAGRADVVVVWDLDRLTRRPIEVEDWIALHEKYGINLVTISENVDLSTDNGRMFLRIKAAVARGEVERKGARQKAAAQQAAQQGRSAGGRRPFGYGVPTGAVRKGVDGRPRPIYDIDKPNEDEAPYVREAYTHLLHGGSLKSLAKRWNVAGATTTLGNAWTHATVRQVVKNPRNAGLRTYRGEVVGPASWPPLVDSETFDAVQALLALPERRTTATTARKYLLPGIALCGRCGSDMATGHTRHGKRVYVCRARKCISRKAEPVDALVAGGEIEGEPVRGLVVERLSRPDAIDLLSDPVQTPDVQVYRRQAAAISQRLDDLATGLEEGILSLAAVRQSSGRLKAELAEVQTRIQSSTHADVLGPLVTASDVEKAWNGYDLQQQRAVIDALMTITLQSPERGRNWFDPATVAVEWKGA